MCRIQSRMFEVASVSASFNSRALVALEPFGNGQAVPLDPNLGIPGDLGSSLMHKSPQSIKHSHVFLSANMTPIIGIY